MWQYPRSLFGLSGYPDYRYRDHGFLFWWVLPASVVVVVSRGNDILKLLAALAVVVFAFFQFYPQYCPRATCRWCVRSATWRCSCQPR